MVENRFQLGNRDDICFMPHVSQVKEIKSSLSSFDIKTDYLFLIPGDATRILSPFIDANHESLNQRIQDILACKVLITSSFHAYTLRRLVGLPVLFASLSDSIGDVSFDNRQSWDLRAYEFELCFDKDFKNLFIQVGRGLLGRLKM